MQRKHVVAAAAVAIIALSGVLIANFFKPRSAPPPQKLPVTQEANMRLGGLGSAMMQEVTITRRLTAPAICDESEKPLLSWRVRMLPYLERFDLYNQFNREEPWDSEHNKQLISQMPDVFKSPLVGDLQGKTVYLLAVGPETVFSDDKGPAIDQITDGPANTIMLVEVDAAHAVPWTKPDDLTIDKNNPGAGLARFSDGTCTVVSADGATHIIPGDADPATFWSLFTRAGGEKVEWPQ
jgi:Protein of unknown function (DUF1559)